MSGATGARAHRLARVERYRRRARGREWGRNLVLFFGSLLVLGYALGPVAWVGVSSIQDEAEIVSVPPHWIPQRPTAENYRAIFVAGQKEVTYATRSKADPSSGGYIPSTAKNLLPGMWNSLRVALAVVLLNLLVGVPAAYAIARSASGGARARSISC